MLQYLSNIEENCEKMRKRYLKHAGDFFLFLYFLSEIREEFQSFLILMACFFFYKIFWFLLELGKTSFFKVLSFLEIYEPEIIISTANADLGDINDLLLEETDYILMTDIQSSSKLLNEYPDKMLDCLRKHYSDADRYLIDQDGLLLDTEGDSCICLFKSLQCAINFANLMMWSSRNYPINEETFLKIRCIIHQGILQFHQIRNSIFCFGETVDEAYKMADKANVGEITISNTIVKKINLNSLYSEVNIVQMCLNNQ